MKKNNKNAKKTGMKAAIVMAAILAVGTPFAIHSYNVHCENTVQTVEVNSASGSKTADSKASQKAENKSAETEKTTTATTETAASKSTAAKKADNKTTTTTAAQKQESKTSTFNVESRNMTVYGTAEAGLNIHSSADASSSCIGSLGYRESVKVTGIVLKDGKDTGWYRVSCNGTIGYVKADYVSATQPAEIPAEPETHTVGTVAMTVSVPDGYLALRNSASDGDNEIGQLYSGTSVEVNKEDLNACNLYVYVTVPSTGMSGYVNVNFLK